MKIKKIIYFIIISISLTTILINAQCPSYTDLLDKGWGHTSQNPHNPQNGNRDEFAAYDPNPFIIKAGQYPPVKSFALNPGQSPFSGCTTNTVYYFSFDTDDEYLPINYRVPKLENTLVKVYRMDQYTLNYISGYSMIVTPPMGGLHGPDIIGAPDFVMKFDGTVHDVAWDLNEYPWENVISNISPYSPSFGVEIVDTNQLSNGDTYEFIADINGGSGLYEIEWYVRNLPNGNFTSVKINELPQNYYNLYGKDYYFYDDEYKYELTMPTNDIEIKVRIKDNETYQEISSTKLISSLPAPVTFVNNIQETENYGHLVLNENKNDLIASGDNRGLILYENYSIRTNELAFIPNFNNTSQKHNRWVTTNEEANILNNIFTFEENSDRRMKARFEETKPASVKTIIDGHPVEGVNLQFRDPWYYYEDQTNWYQSDTLKTYESPLNLSTSSINDYGGVFLNQNPSFDPQLPGYKVSISPTQTINYNNRSHKIYFNNWSDNGKANFQDTASVQTPVVFTDGGAEVYANHKGSLLSNTQYAFNGPSQRKIARTSDGYYHLVYESMGRVWYEYSSDNGNTWNMATNWELMSSNEGKYPSLDAMGSQVLIVFQQKTSSGSELKSFSSKPDPYNPGKYYFHNSYTTVEASSSYPDTKPVVAIHSEHTLGIVAWIGASGYIKYKRLSDGQTNIYPTKTFSYYYGNKNLSIAANRNSSPDVYHIAFQSTDDKIRYTKITGDNYGTFTTLSDNSGYENHWNPDVVVAGSMVYVGFVGQRYEAGEEKPGPIQWKTNAFGGGGSLGEWKERGLLRSFNGSNWSGIIKALGSDVNDIALNTAGSNVVFAYYTETNGWLGESYYTKGVQSADGFNSIFNISDGGKSFMLSNGSSVNNMKWFDVDFLGNHLEPLEPPYSLKNGNITTQYKVGSSDNYALIGREGITTRDSVQFYFTFGEIIVDGVQVNFVDIPDSMKEIKNTNQLNKYLVSEPFTLNDNSEFTYGIMCGVADSSDVDIALKKNEFINFKVELIDGQSSHVLGVYDNVTFTADSINYYANKNYLVNTNGVGNKTVRLRMQIKDNFKQSYSLGNLLVEDSLMYKRGYHELHYKGELLVKEYNLVQNYPNPFNPSTIIKYQIPKAGNVKLIVYDILGREVAKLIDEFQNDGRYEVKFDASNLSSGIYIYRLEANDFVDSKKMMLVK